MGNCWLGVAATDPVAVIAMFKDTGVTGRLRLLVESESLFNDGVAAVFFVLVLVAARTAGGESMTTTSVAQALVVTVAGGLFIGALGGGVAILVAGSAADHLVETALIAVALVIVGRALAVYPLCLLFSRSCWAVRLREQHVL